MSLDPSSTLAPAVPGGRPGLPGGAVAAVHSPGQAAVNVSTLAWEGFLQVLAPRLLG